MVMVNLPTAGVDYHVPFGGRKGSSYGPREQGALRARVLHHGQDRLHAAVSGGFAGASGDLSARRDRQLADDLVAARRDEPVDHVDDDADVVRHDADDVADLRPVVALRQIEEAVLLGEPCDLGLGMLEDQAVALEAAGVARSASSSRRRGCRAPGRPG